MLTPESLPIEEVDFFVPCFVDQFYPDAAMAAVEVLANQIPFDPYPVVFVFLILETELPEMSTPAVAPDRAIPVAVPVLVVDRPVTVLPEIDMAALATPEVTTIPLGPALVPLMGPMVLFVTAVFTVPVASHIPVRFDASAVFAILPTRLFWMVAPSTPCA